MDENLKSIDRVEGFHKQQKDKSYLFKSGSYLVSIAQNEKEVEMALRLRYEVFCKEPLMSLVRSSDVVDIETDLYDIQCHHLLVIDQISGLLVGTYRLQTFEMAKGGNGFYSENEFDLSNLPISLLKRSVETGRACIRKEFRNNRILFLLWKGVAAYLLKMGKSVVFGCCSIFLDDYRKGWHYYRLLNEKGFFSSDYLVPVQPDYQIPQPVVNKNSIYNAGKMPVLFKKYLEIGAKIISYPAFDHDFGTVDFLVILDVTDMNRSFLNFVMRDIS